MSSEKPAYSRKHRLHPWLLMRWYMSLVLLALLGLLPPGLGQGAAKRTIEEVRFRSDAGTTRVVIEADGAVQHSVGRLPTPERLYVDLMQSRLAPGWEKKQLRVTDGRIRAIRIAQHRTGVVRVVLDLQAAQDYTVFTLQQPYRIVIDLHATGSAPPPKTQSKPPTIVIDPGHGGKDPGAVGRRSLQEKVVVLQVAQALQELLRRKLPHARVILTRERDVFVPLEERANIANTQQADIFLSIHANASKRREVRGIETWYLSFAANSERAQRIAARENNMSTHQLSELARILHDLQETDRINQSAVLAGLTQKALVNFITPRYTAPPDRGVDGAPFVVLLRTDMPGILVEIGFISNPTEEKRLRSRQYRLALAQGIFRGVHEFLRTSVVQAE